MYEAHSRETVCERQGVWGGGLKTGKCPTEDGSCRKNVKTFHLSYCVLSSAISGESFCLVYFEGEKPNSTQDPV